MGGRLRGGVCTGQRYQGQPGEQPLGGDQPLPLPRAVRALAGVAGYPLAPEWARYLVPARREFRQLRAAGRVGERPDHHPGRLQLVLHPLHPDRRVLRRQLHRRRELGPAELARRLLPPQREQVTVVLVQPAGRLRRLAALTGQAEPQDGQPHEVRTGVGRLVHLRLGGLLGLLGLAVLVAAPAGCRRRAASSPAPRRRCPGGRRVPGPRCCRPAAGGRRSARSWRAGPRSAPVPLLLCRSPCPSRRSPSRRPARFCPVLMGDPALGVG